MRATPPQNARISPYPQSLSFSLEALNHTVMRLSLIITDPYQYQFAIKIM